MASISAFWSIPGNVERLQALIAEKKYTGTQIARMMGVSRNTILGKAHRMKLEMLAPDNPYSLARTRPRAPIVSKPLPKPVESLERRKPLNFSIDALSDAVCRFPYGAGPSYVFCGRAVKAGKVYCEACCEVAYQKPIARAR